MNKYMQLAISEAKEGIDAHHGGPFGSVVVKDGRIISMGHNHVLINNDSTCHGEVDAIRKAEHALGTFDLTGCDVYTTGQCCPMCLFALKWANVRHVYYGCTLKDNEMIGFRDDVLNNSVKRDDFKDFETELDRDECLKLFEYYNKMDKELY